MRSRLLLGVLLAVGPVYAADELTVYDLLAPESHQFAIVYDVTATREGARYFFNPIRQGAIATKESVLERSSGQQLHFETVSAKDAKQTGLVSPRTSDDQQFIRVTLPGPVPKNGETRIRILKTYTDAKSYFADGDKLTFDRPLGIRRNVVILPAGYELTASASPAIVSTQSDGRLRLSFLNDRDDQLPVRIQAVKRP